MYLVDTDHVVSHLNGRTEALRLLSALRPQGVALSVMTYGEIFDGIYLARDPAGAQRTFRQFLDGVRVLPVNRPIMRRFAQLRGNLRRRGQLLPDADLIVASTALHHKLTLVTRNQRHFTRVPGLNLHV